MGKKWGKRGKGRQPGLEMDPLAMFGPPPAPRSAPPASSTPLADYLRRGGLPGVDEGYVVLPRAIAEGMPLPWQQQMVNLLAQFHDTHARLSWPSYRVVPSRPERLTDLDEEQLAEAGYLVEIDSDGEMVYRERSGRKVEDPENTTVLVSCLDPIVRERQAARPAAGPQQGRPAPMNIGPQPVWRSAPASSTPPAAPPLPPPPTAPSLSPSGPGVSGPGGVESGGAASGEREPAGSPASGGSGSAGERMATPVRIEPGTAWSAEPRQPEGSAESQGGDQSQPSAARAAEPPAPGAQPASGSTPAAGSQGAAHPGTSGEPAAQSAQPEAAQPPEPARTAERGWFDELPGEAAQGGTAFGPTGDEPTEIPYRYRR
ncbi:hypothetical protein ACFS2C_19590 [Prauserella oleivorans]|uniref:Uncharacterized protein n=1 Tax=Prauserella oleivorans TaxID=1478153 RepID=A0ABW5WCD3_9PSEU